MFTHTVNNNIIRIPFEWDTRISPLHPFVECVVEEEIRQQRTDDTALRRAFIPACKSPVLQLSMGFKPALNVKQYPLAVGVLAHGTHHQFMVQIVKKPFDIQIQNPVVVEASLAGYPYGLHC